MRSSTGGRALGDISGSAPCDDEEADALLARDAVSSSTANASARMHSSDWSAGVAESARFTSVQMAACCLATLRTRGRYCARDEWLDG